MSYFAKGARARFFGPRVQVLVPLDSRRLPVDIGPKIGLNLSEIQSFFGFHWPPTPVGQGQCGFDQGRSLELK